MGLFGRFRLTHIGEPREQTPPPTEPVAHTRLVPPERQTPTSAAALARELLAENPDGVPVDVLVGRAEAAGLDVQAVDRVLDQLAEVAAVTVRTVKPAALRVVDLSGLDSVRTRIKGSGYWVTDAERRRFGGREYLLVCEPDNEADPHAVAVYGKGRKVGHLSAARAASLTPLLDQLGGEAYRVTGTGVTANSTVLWVDVPKVDALRKFVRGQNT